LFKPTAENPCLIFSVCGEPPAGNFLIELNDHFIATFIPNDLTGKSDWNRVAAPARGFIANDPHTLALQGSKSRHNGYPIFRPFLSSKADIRFIAIWIKLDAHGLPQFHAASLQIRDSAC
jgi:hypothetical protein